MSESYKVFAEQFSKLPPKQQAAIKARLKTSFAEFKPQLAAAVAEYNKVRDELASYHHHLARLPDTLDDLEKLAGIIGIDDLRGWTAGEIVGTAIEWAKGEIHAAQRAEIRESFRKQAKRVLASGGRKVNRSSSDARDKWLYEKLSDITETEQSVADECTRLAPLKDWRPITTPQGVSQAANRWAKRKGKPPLPPRKFSTE